MTDRGDEQPGNGLEAAEDLQQEDGEFGELLRYTLAGYLGGLILGALLDGFGLHRSSVGQWLVRTLSGEGESILEGIYAFGKRLRGGPGSVAEAYGWGKLIGMCIPWIVDWGSRAGGLDVYAVEGFYIPYFYALSDQMGASASGFLYLRRREGSWARGGRAYFRHPVMLAGLPIILVVPLALVGARIVGFSPTTQVYTALETIVANLCWIPPLVGWMMERRNVENRN